MYLNDECPEGENLPSEQAPALPERRRVHPITWVAAAALLPLLVWDIRETLQDVKHRQASAASARPAAAARFHGL